MVPPLTKLSQSSSPSPEQGASEEVVRALVFLFVRVEVEFRDFCTFNCSYAVRWLLDGEVLGAGIAAS